MSNWNSLRSWCTRRVPPKELPRGENEFYRAPGGFLDSASRSDGEEEADLRPAHWQIWKPSRVRIPVLGAVAQCRQ